MLNTENFFQLELLQDALLFLITMKLDKLIY